MKRIVFNLKREWYDRIERGEKSIEYRRICKHWAVRLGIVWPIGDSAMTALKKGVKLTEDSGYTAVFRLGYGRNHPDIVRRIVRVDVGACPYDGWDGEYFRIGFTNARLIAAAPKMYEKAYGVLNNLLTHLQWPEETIRMNRAEVAAMAKELQDALAEASGEVSNG